MAHLRHWSKLSYTLTGIAAGWWAAAFVAANARTADNAAAGPTSLRIAFILFTLLTELNLRVKQSGP